MKNFFRLLIVVGLITAGWLNRDKLRGLSGKAGTTEESEAVAAAPPPVAAAVNSTPHPAAAARAAAAKAYPALLIPDSAFNKRFISFYEDAQSRDPALLRDPNWPLKIAERAALSLGGGPMPATPTPSSGAKSSPNKLKGSVLDMRPGSGPAH